MKFENSWTGNWENAFHGLRHPMESYAKSDSDFGLADDENWVDAAVNEVAYSYIDNCKDENVDISKDEIIEHLYENGALDWGKHHACEYAFIGHNDMDLAQRMIKAGSPNDKFLRQIFVSIDITAPLYWWKEMDTYKVGTTANSTSTMHKLASTPITIDCFETDDFDPDLSVEYDIDHVDGKFHYDFNMNYLSSEIINKLEQLRKKYLETKDKRYWKELIRWLPESWLQTRTWTANYATLRNIYHWRKDHKLSEWRTFCQFLETLPYAKELIMFDN